MIRYIVLFLVCFRPDAFFSQPSRYARQIIDTLASPGMHGRGYVNGGDQLAAHYIRDEFRRLQLKSFEPGYFQNFTLAVNTFPANVQLLADGQTLLPGVDYLVQSNSPGCQGTYPLLWLNASLLKKQRKLKKFLGQDLDGKAVVLTDPGSSDKSLLERYKQASALIPSKAALTVQLQTKLTWSVSRQVASRPSFSVLKDKLPPNSNTIQVNIENEFIPRYTSQNVIAYVEGTEKDSFLVFSAHYDHLGRMGKDTYFPGANDNASGTAMLLNLAEHFSKSDKPHYSIAFIAFAAEEAGLVGSRFYTEHPLFPLGHIKFLINMDILGTGDEGITVVNATEHPEAFKTLLQINEKQAYLKSIKSRGKAPNSDHHFFSEKGVNAFFIYTLGGIKAYHDVHDKAETLPLTEFDDLFRLLCDFTAHLSGAKQ